MLPRTFLKLPEAFARKMYPSEYRPDVIRTSPSMTYQEVLDCVVGQYQSGHALMNIGAGTAIGEPIV